MKFVCLFLFLCTMANSLLSQPVKKYFIQFADKANSPYSLSNPLDFLSQRALDRRTHQNINLAENDLPVSPFYVDSLEKMGAVVVLKLKWLNGVVIENPDPTLLATINSLGFVVSAKAVTKQVKQTSLKLEDFYNQSNIQRSISMAEVSAFNYGGSYTQVHQIGCNCLHASGYTGKGKVIAVLDAGFPGVDVIPALDSMRADNRLLGYYDFVSNNTQVFDDNSHGTNVTSIIGGNLDGQLIGTAPHASFILLRSEEAEYENIVEEYNWVAAAEFADSAGADVINSSLGYTTFDDPSQNHTYADMNGDVCPSSVGADIAVSKGIFVVNSAGNSGGGSWYYIGAPADADSVLAVGAVDNNGVIAGFSSRGPASDGAVKPNVVAMGVGTTLSGPDGTIYTGSGTSFSGPVVAGAVASLWQAFPNVTNMQLKAAVENSAHLHSNPNSDYGYGLPDFCVAKVLLASLNTKTGENSDPLLFPSPFLDELKIVFYTSDSQLAKITVTDLAGKIVFKTEVNTVLNGLNYITPQLQFLSAGAYFVNVSGNNLDFTRKVIKKTEE